MNIPKVIYQLRNYCPLLVSVAGAAEYNAVIERANMPMPAAYVIPMSDDATENDSPNALFQWVIEHVGIMVALDNTTDQLGEATSQVTADDVRTALWQALLNWHMDPTQTTWSMEYRGKHLISQDRARIWYNYVFSQKICVDESNGFQLDGPALTDVIMSAPGGLSFGANIASPPIIT